MFWQRSSLAAQSLVQRGMAGHPPPPGMDNPPVDLADHPRWMYDNLELWGSTQEQQDAAILIIAKGLRNIPMVADQEINLAATLVELCQIS